MQPVDADAVLEADSLALVRYHGVNTLIGACSRKISTRSPHSESVVFR